MFNAAIADTIAAALEAIAQGLRSGVLLSSAFDMKHPEDCDENDVLLTLRFIDLTVSNADDVDDSTAPGPRSPGPVGATVSLLPSAANACPECGSPKTVDAASNGHEGERLCLNCNKTWSPVRATGA